MGMSVEGVAHIIIWKGRAEVWYPVVSVAPRVVLLVVVLARGRLAHLTVLVTLLVSVLLMVLPSASSSASTSTISASVVTRHLTTALVACVSDTKKN